jgi:hypothetical protein
MSVFLPPVVGAVVGAVVSGTIFYFVGLHHGRQQVRYERRAVTVTDLQRRLREARETFGNLATPRRYQRGGESWNREEELQAAQEKLDALDGYLQDNSVWLDEQAVKALDDYTDALAMKLVDIEAGLTASEDEADRAIESAWQWLDGVGAELAEEGEAELRRALEPAAPWWRRVFGG